MILHRLWLIVYAPLLVVLTLCATSVLYIIQLFSGPRFASHVIAPPWARLLARLLPIRVTVSRDQRLDKQQAYVVVANHLSQLDILVIYGWSALDMRWVIKQEIRKVPIIGWACKVAGHVFIDRSDREAAKRKINTAVGELEPGEGMLFFPEGTRSKSGQLLEFKSGAFRTALKQQIPILPLTITGTHELFPPGAKLPRFGRCHLHIHQPIEVAGVPDNPDTARQLRDQTRSIIANRLTYADNRNGKQPHAD